MEKEIHKVEDSLRDAGRAIDYGYNKHVRNVAIGIESIRDNVERLNKFINQLLRDISYDKEHKYVSFDDVLQFLKETYNDLQHIKKETDNASSEFKELYSFIDISKEHIEKSMQNVDNLAYAITKKYSKVTGTIELPQ